MLARRFGSSDCIRSADMSTPFCAVPPSAKFGTLKCRKIKVYMYKKQQVIRKKTEQKKNGQFR